jgi:hypothetical protein
MKWVVDGLGFVTGDGEDLARVVARGEHVFVTPGGIKEGCRSFRHRYEVDWGNRMGYVRLALKHRLPIVPVAAAGVDDTYLGLNDGHALGKRLGAPARLPVWLGLGPLGLWPISPPFPAKFRQLIGAPIDLEAEGPVDPRDTTAIEALHRRVQREVGALLARARTSRG